MKRFPLRRNVLYLILSAYVSLLFIFVCLMWPGYHTADVAYDLIEGPLMAVIGGTLALAKDLVDHPSDGDPTTKSDDKVDTAHSAKAEELEQHET